MPKSPNTRQSRPSSSCSSARLSRQSSGLRPPGIRRSEASSSSSVLAEVARELAISPRRSPRKKKAKIPSIEIEDDSDVEIIEAPVRGSALSQTPSLSRMVVDSPCSTTSDDQNSLYSPRDDEIYGDEGQQIGREHLVAYDVDDEGNPVDVPVFFLEGFSLFSAETHKMVSLHDLLAPQGGHNIHAAGYAFTSDLDDDGSESDTSDVVEEGQYVHLIDLKRVSIHDFNIDNSDPFDHKIYLLTKCAWYTLGSPSKSYRNLYQIFWSQHRMMHILLAVTYDDPEISYEALQEAVPTFAVKLKDPPTAMAILGRELHGRDFDSSEVRAYISGYLDDFWPEIRERPALYDYFTGLEDPDSSSECASDEDMDDSFHSLTGSPKAPASGKSKPSPTIVTPIVRAVAEHFDSPLFKENLGKRKGNRLETGSSSALKDTTDLVRHKENPKSVEWDLQHDHGLVGTRHFYTRAKVDGIIYEAGDMIAVEPGEDDNRDRAMNDQSRAAKSTLELANTAWFARICYFFEDGRPKKLKRGEQPEKMFHLQWYTHGSKTLLQEAAHPRTLFQLNECDDNPVSSVLGKIKPKCIGENNTMPTEDSGTEFYYGLVWDEHKYTFTSIPTKQSFAELCEKYGENCFSCALKKRDKEFFDIQAAGDDDMISEIRFAGLKCHIHDFVYISTRKPKYKGILQIGQIVNIYRQHKDIYISTLLLERSDSSDNCHLSFTTTTRNWAVDDIDGLCFVKSLSDGDDILEWTAHPDHYYIDWDDDFQYCDDCLSFRCEEVRAKVEETAKSSPLKTLEVFCGAGGLSIGLEQSGISKTEWAVELDKSAADSFKYNHPDACVYQEDVNILVAEVIKQDEGFPTTWSNLPRKRQVGLIAAGPPCQSFSGANHSKKPNDSRSTLVCSVLSLVEVLQPDYVLIENVAGFLHHKLYSSSSTDTIDHGMVKFVYRALIDLGYQVHYQLLNAIQYGAPQSRIRIIFWAARYELELPEFPIPTHSLPPNISTRWNKSPLLKQPLPPTTRSRYGSSLLYKGKNRWHQEAPHHFTTIQDSCSDLPAFEWVIPSANKMQKQIMKARKQQGIAQFHAVGPEAKSRGTCVTGYELTSYALPPQNRYQAWLRQGTNDLKVGAHYTKTYSEDVVTRVVHVPLEANASSKDLPPFVAIPDYIQNRPDKIFYGRCGYTSYFRTAMTKVNPGGKATRHLHPKQKRIYSVRESARGQGFPDHYEFCSPLSLPHKLDKQYKQIGNAVPVPLSLALGRSLLESILKTKMRLRSEHPESDHGTRSNSPTTSSWRANSPEA